MSLVYKSSVRENITDLQTYIVDTTPTSTRYFRVSDVPQVLQKGKNLLRITAHPTNLVPGSQVYVDVRDSNGNPIYYEIPDYLEEDKSRVISIWIYHDKGEDNTPNGEAIITLAGTANVDENGNVLPERHRGKINVKWQRVVTVDRNRSNTSEIIFKSDNLPNVIVSQSVDSFQNQAQSDSTLLQTTQTGKASYIKSGFSPIVQLTDGTEFNSEMVGGSIILSNYTEVAQPQTSIENPLSSTFYSSSINGLLNSTAARVTTAYTTSFENREDLTHTYTNISEADYKITYYQSGSNVATENYRNFVTLTLNNVDPITGVVDKIKILQKSEGLPGDYELVNEVTVPFSSSLEVKVPIPSKNLNDPKILKLQYLNSVGSISRTETITTPFVFEGENVYIGGNQNMISGSIFISNTLGTGIEIGGASSGFIRSVGYNGITSASLGKGPGGFVIYSGSGNLVFGEDNLEGVGVEFVGDNDDRHFIFTTANGGLLDVKTDKFFIGTEDTQFISGSDGNIEISSSLFHLDPTNNILYIGADAVIDAGLSVNELFTPATINGAPSNITNASSSITSQGFAKFVSASIGGWTVSTASIEAPNLILKPEGVIQTRDYIKDFKGWIISSEDNGFAEFENIKIRGTLSTTTFEKESVNAVGGQLYVANSTTVSGSYSSSLDVTPSSFITSSTTLPADFGVGDKVDVSGTKYSVVSINPTDTTKFRINQSLRLDNTPATLLYSSSLSPSATITAHETINTVTNTPHSASIDNGLKISTGDTNFQTTNETVTTPLKATITLFEDYSSSIFAQSDVFDLGGKASNNASGVMSYNSTEGRYYYLLQKGTVFSQDLLSGQTFDISFTSSSISTTYGPTETITRISGQWLPSVYNSNDDGEITFDDGSGNKTYQVKNRISSTQLTVVTSSGFEPNTSGSSVSATLQFSASYDDEVTLNSGVTTAVEHRFPNVSPSASVFVVQNVSGFAQNEILTLKKVTNTGFSTEYVKVDSTQRLDAGSDTDLSGLLTVTRSYGSGTTGDSSSLGDIASTAQSYEEGQVIVSTGKIGSGYIRINANPNDTSTPYIDIVERTGSGLYDVELKARLGDLSGLSDTPLVLNKSNPGFGLATDNVYLQGGISATFGDIGGFGITQTAISSSNDNLILKSNGQITASAANISGDIVTDNITATGGTIGGFELGSNIISSSNGNLILKSDGQITGSNVFFDGGTIGGFETTANTIKSTETIVGLGTPLEFKSGGEITGSSVLIRQRVSGTNYTLFDTKNGIVDGRNVGRQVISDTTEYSEIGGNSNGNGTFVDKTYWIFPILPGETKMMIGIHIKATRGSATTVLNSTRLQISSGSEAYGASYTATAYDDWSTPYTIFTQNTNVTSTNATSVMIVSPDYSAQYSINIPAAYEGKMCKLTLQMKSDTAAGTPNSGTTLRARNISVVTSRDFSSDFSSAGGIIVAGPET